MIELIVGIIAAFGGIISAYLLYKRHKREKRKEHSEHFKKLIKIIQSWIENLNILYDHFSLKIKIPKEPDNEYVQSHLKSGYKKDCTLLNEIIKDSSTLPTKYSNFVAEIKEGFEDIIERSKKNLDYNLETMLRILCQSIFFSLRGKVELTYEKRKEGQHYYLTIKEFSAFPSQIWSDEESNLDIAISIIEELINNEEFIKHAQNIDEPFKNINKKLQKFKKDLWNKIDLGGDILKGTCKLC